MLALREMDISDFGTILKEHGIRSGSGVPCSYFKPLVNYMGADPELDYLGAASEGEAVAIAAGMVVAGKPAFALMQNSGLGNAVNPITSMLEIYQIPVVLLVSHRGQPDGAPDEPQHKRMGMITKELIELCGIEGHYLREDSFEAELSDMLGRGVPAGWVCQKGTLTGGPKAPPISFSVETDPSSDAKPGKYTPEVTREEALRSILSLLNDSAHRVATVATTGKLSRELYELDDQDHSKAGRFYMVGSMGCAAGFALGVARGYRNKVVCLDGDGALLMKLGTLATATLSGQTNFHHVVIDNGAHESTGGQPTASPYIDTAAVARHCGYHRTDTACSIDDFREKLEAHLGTDGPTLLRMLVKTGSRDDLGRPKLAPRDAYLRFKDFLASGAR